MGNKHSERREASKRAREKKKTLVRNILVILLCLLLVGSAIFPIFAETVDKVDEDYKGLIDYMLETIDENYYQDASERSMIDGAYKGIFQSLDPYSFYFTEKEFNDFNTSIEGFFGGIGAHITEGNSGYVEIVAPMKGTPAEAAGLLPGDKIVKIDGVEANGLTSEQAVSKIRGKEGTDVVLTIMRDGEMKPFDVKITRAVIIIKSVNFELLESGIGYIELTGFNETTNKEFDEAMAYMANNDVKKLIVDVRNNPGGLLPTAIYVSDYFIKEGDEIVKIDYKNRTDRVYKASRAKAPMDLVVLINEGSASASEIFAGSIKANKAGTIIGANSFGKGTVQELSGIKTGGGFKLTVAEYLLKGNTKVHGVGIKPDIEVGKLLPRANLAPLESHLGLSTLNTFAVQQRLALLGYEVKADGNLTKETRTAIKAFEKDYGLTEDGILDTQTMEEIERVVMKPSELQLERAIEFLKNK